MTGGDENKQGSVPHQQSRELINQVASTARDFVAERLELLLGTAVEQFLDTAGETANRSEQSQFFDAYKRLRQERQALGNALLMAVDYNFRELGRPVLHGADGDDLSLQLMANDILEEMITLDNMVSKVVSRCGQPMELLTKRLSAVVGWTLAEQDNPLVPEFLCEALSRQVATLGLDTAPKFALYRVFEAVMLSDWPNLVQACNDHLREAGVLPDLERRRPAIKKQLNAADASPKVASPPAADTGPQPGEGAHQAAPVRTRRGERTIFARAEDSARKAGATGMHGRSAGAGSAFGRNGDETSGDVIADLQRQLREQSAAAGRGEGTASGLRGATSPPRTTLDTDQLSALFSAWRENRDREQFAAQLSSGNLEEAVADILAGANHGPESLCGGDRGLLNVVDRTFSRLADKLRQQHETDLLLNLELPAAWLALTDPLFLERQSHPGRRLFNELCRVASTLGGEESGSDPLRRKMDEIVERLNGFDVTLRQLSELLTDLIDVVEKDRRTTTLREDRVLQEADSQARMAEAHEQVVQILTDRLVGRRWPAFLVPFCERAWGRVLFLTWLRQGNPGGYSREWRQVQGLLDRILVLTSARRPVAETERVELVAAIGSELEHIGYDPGESRRYLDSLDAFLSGLGSGAVRDDYVFTEAIAVDLPGQKPCREEVPLDIDAETLAYVDALRRGAWVEFHDAGGKPLRCKLAGTVSAASRLIFTSRRGVKVAEEHRHRMAVKMHEGKVIVLDNSHLFDQAYSEVISEVQGELRGQPSRAG